MAEMPKSVTKAMEDAAERTLGESVVGQNSGDVRYRLRRVNAAAAVAAKGSLLTAEEAHNLIADKLGDWFPGVKKIAKA